MIKQLGGVRHTLAIMAISALVAACAPAVSQTTGTAVDGQPGAASPSTLVLALRREPSALTPLPLFSAAGPISSQTRLFNASLSYQDGAGGFHPYLAEALPELNTDSWRVFPDGRMDTTWRLRPGLTWHDGAPLRASDYVFGWRIGSDAELGLSGLAPHKLMEEVVAADDQTLRIRWGQPFPDAAHLDAWSRGLIFVPLPQHLLADVRVQGADAFRNHSFWTVDYVGVGPYRMERWELGAFLEARAFDGHAIGRPKIDRLKALFITDVNAILAALLTEEAHMPIDYAIGMTEGLVLRERWGQGRGNVAFLPATLRRVDVQHRPDYANPPAILDVRVRRALAHAIDKQTLNEVMYDGQGLPTDTIAMPGNVYFPIIERAIARYPYDVRRTEQLMAEAGFPRDREGVYAQPGAGRLTFELLAVVPAAENLQERSLVAAGWRSAGFQVDEGLVASGSAQKEAGSTFRSLVNTAGNVGINGVSRFISEVISRAETRWTGENSSGWSNPDYDRAVTGVQTALDPAERGRYFAEAARVMSEDLGAIFLYFSPRVVAYPATLEGIALTDPETEPTWNIHEWRFQ